MRTVARLIAAAVVVAAAAAPAAARPVHHRAAAPPAPQDMIGTWRGTASWRGCTVTGGRHVAIELHYRRGGDYEIDLAGARDDLGAVTLTATSDGTLSGTLHDLKVTMTPGKHATVVLASAAGCGATISISRDTTGIPACDRLVAFDEVATTCDPEDELSRSGYAAARAKIAGWRALRGAKKDAAARTCRGDADKVAAALAARSCLPSPGAIGGSGIPECDAYLAEMQRLVQCPKFPVQAKQAMQQALAQAAQGWQALRDPSVPAESRRTAAQACTQATQALRQAAAQMGCPTP